VTNFNRRNFVILGTTAASIGGMGLGCARPTATAEKGASSVKGECDPVFALVREEFEKNFASREELGAAVAVYKDGQKVVDLWGGVADPATGKPWDKDTIVVMASVGKGVAAVCTLMCVDRGLIDLDERVAHYWPEFGQAGKENITVRTLMQAKAGVLYADAAADGAIIDWNAMIKAIEVQKPEWTPGEGHGYHSMTMGFLLGELVHRADGRMINTFLEEEIVKPLGVDYHWGLNDEQIARAATFVPNPKSSTKQMVADPTTKLYRAWHVNPKGVTANDEISRRAVIPSSNGQGNARAIGRLYAALANGGSLDGVRLMSPELVEVARTESWKGLCAMTDRDYRYGTGFFLNYPPNTPFGPNSRTFGHPGAGGAVGFADPENGIAFSYSPNFMCEGAGLGDRCEALINATYGVRT